MVATGCFLVVGGAADRSRRGELFGFVERLERIRTHLLSVGGRRVDL